MLTIRVSGLSLGLRTNMSEYADWTQTAGFWIFVHDPVEAVLMESTRYSSAPGERLTVALEQVRYRPTLRVF